MSGDSHLSVALRARMGRAEPFEVDITFTAPPGITILFGPSGAGKSTTMAAIAGLVRPQAGRVTYGSEVWFDGEKGIDEPAERRGVSMVFQSPALFPHMNGAHNVEYGLDRRLPAPERRRRAAAMLERMKVSHLARRRPGTYSGGEAQRVALARAFARTPRVVLLDEAFSALDRDLRRELCADVRSMVKELRIPAILVTHHRMEAQAMGDYVVILKAGRVLAQGPILEHLGEVMSDFDERVDRECPQPVRAQRQRS